MSGQPAYTGVPEVPAQAEPTGYQSLNISPQAFGADVAKGVEQVGQSGQDLALQFQQMHNQTQALNAGSDYAKQVGQIESDYHQLEGTNATAALPDYQKRIQDLNTKFSTDLGPAAQRMFLQDTRSLTDGTMVRMGSHAGEQAKAAHNDALLGSVTQTRSNITRQALAGQTINPQDLDDLVTRVAQYGQFRGMEKPAVDAFLQKQTGDMATDVIDATLAKGDPDSTARANDIFQDLAKRNIPGTDLPMMDGDHLARISQTIKARQFYDNAQAERADAHQAASLRTAITGTISNTTAMVERGLPIPDTMHLPSEAEIDQAWANNPEMAEAVKDHVSTVLNMSRFATELTGATPEQVTKLRASVQPDPTRPDFAHQATIAAAFDHTLDVRNRAIYGTAPSEAHPQGTAGDPANYVMLTHPELQPVLEGALKDPGLWANYAHAQETLQSQMGVPDAQRHMLPATLAQSMAQSLQANPTNAPQQMRGLQAQFGDNWNKAWKDLVGLGHLPPEFQLVGTLPAGDAAVLARALTAGGHNGKNIEDLLPATQAGDQHAKANVDLAIEGNGDVRAYLDSTRAQGFSDAGRLALLNGIKKLAYGNMVDRGMSAGDAASAAAQAVTSSYRYLGAARIPADRFDTVSQNAAQALQNLKPGQVQVPALFGQPVKSADGTVLAAPAMSGDDYVRNLQASPRWITSPTGDGLNLMDLGGRIVRDTRGKPVTVPFNTPPPSRPVTTVPNPFTPPPATGAPFSSNETPPARTGEGGPLSAVETVSAPGGWTGHSAAAIDLAGMPPAVRAHIASLGDDRDKIAAYLNQVDPAGRLRGVTKTPAEAAAPPGGPDTPYRPGEVEAFNQADRDYREGKGTPTVSAQAGIGEAMTSPGGTGAERAIHMAPKTAAELDRMFPAKPGEVPFSELEKRREVFASASDPQAKALGQKLLDIKQHQDDAIKLDEIAMKAASSTGAERDALLHQLDGKWDQLTLQQKILVARLHMNRLPESVLSTLGYAAHEATR